MGEKAKYYRCALQVNSSRYARYRGDIPQEDLEYNRQILEHCSKNNIEVIVLADHGNVDASSSLRELLSSAGITVFPGFEISSAEKRHMVSLSTAMCLFSLIVLTLSHIENYIYIFFCDRDVFLFVTVFPLLPVGLFLFIQKLRKFNMQISTEGNFQSFPYLISSKGLFSSFMT